jgi:hypothetical protein
MSETHSPKRSGKERRSGFDNRGLKATERECLALCKQAGVQFAGIQSGFNVAPDLVLFNNAHGSTLALPVEGITVGAIIKRVLESEGAWFKAA